MARLCFERFAFSLCKLVAIANALEASSEIPMAPATARESRSITSHLLQEDLFKIADFDAQTVLALDSSLYPAHIWNDRSYLPSSKVLIDTGKHKVTSSEMDQVPQKKIAKTRKLELDEYALSTLMLVSVMPMTAVQEDGWIRVKSHANGQATDTFRPAIYFALSTIVPDELLGTVAEVFSGSSSGMVESRKLVVMIPYKNLEHRVLNVWPFDSPVVGDIDLKTVGAVLLRPNGEPLNLSSDALEHIQVLDYGEEGKRAKVDSWLEENGYARRTYYKKLALGRWSVDYKMPNGHLYELGAGIDDETDDVLGKETTSFLSSKYGGTVSFGPEAFPVYSNNATVALLPLTILTNICHNLLSQDIKVDLWKGWAQIGDYLFTLLETHAFAFKYPYSARDAQFELWTKCKHNYYTQDGNYSGNGGFDPMFIQRGAQLRADVQVGLQVVGNVACVFAEENSFSNLYNSYSQDCASTARESLRTVGRNICDLSGGVLRRIPDRDEMLADLDVVKPVCEEHGWYQILNDCMWSVFNSIPIIVKSVPKDVPETVLESDSGADQDSGRSWLLFAFPASALMIFGATAMVSGFEKRKAELRRSSQQREVELAQHQPA